MFIIYYLGHIYLQVYKPRLSKQGWVIKACYNLQGLDPIGHFLCLSFWIDSNPVVWNSSVVLTNGLQISIPSVSN